MVDQAFFSKYAIPCWPVKFHFACRKAAEDAAAAAGKLAATNLDNEPSAGESSSEKVVLKTTHDNSEKKEGRWRHNGVVCIFKHVAFFTSTAVDLLQY